MFRKIGRVIFLSFVLLAGILAGSINTSKIISYAKQANDYEKIEKQEIQQKSPRLKKKISYRIQVV